MSSFDLLPCPALVTNQGGLVQSVNQSLLQLVGETKDTWVSKPMDLMFSVASRIFVQTHVWPLILREGQVHEVRLQVLGQGGKQIPVLVNCQKITVDGIERFTWVIFVSIERSRYEQELLDARHRAEAASIELAKSERFSRTVADAMPSLIAYWDTQMLCRFANKPYWEWFGKLPEQMIGMPLSAVLGPRLYELNLPYAQRALVGESQEFERTIDRPDGTRGYVLANYIPDIDAMGTVKGFFALVTNITRMREAEAAIRLSASVFEATTEGIMVTDTEAKIVSVNSAFTKLTGYAADEIVGQNARILKSGRHDADFYGAMFDQLGKTKFFKGEVWNKRKDGSIYLEQLSISAICDDAGDVTRYVGVCSDITDRWDRDQLVRHMALHDGLTGLPNRSLLMERLNQLIAMSDRELQRIALIFLDLDGFKSVNDTLGHEAGDMVLKTVSSRLLALLRPSDTVTRLGGDEFVILLHNPNSRESVALIASRVIEEINIPMDVDGKAVHVGASLGIALSSGKDEIPDRLLKKADDAMYVAKSAGKNVYRFSE